MLSREAAKEMAWDFARKVAEIDKQLLSNSAVCAVAATILAVQDETAREIANSQYLSNFAAMQVRARFGLEGK